MSINALSKQVCVAKVVTSDHIKILVNFETDITYTHVISTSVWIVYLHIGGWWHDASITNTQRTIHLH